jgi:hypothetical protein
LSSVFCLQNGKKQFLNRFIYLFFGSRFGTDLKEAGGSEALLVEIRNIIVVAASTVYLPVSIRAFLRLILSFFSKSL